MTEIELDQFITKVDRRDGGCWEWTGSRNSSGYGMTGKGLAHRRSYELFVGPIPEGLQILHKCHNRPCVNPTHLYPGTQKQNMDDCREAGRLAVGERNGRAKHSSSKVDEVRRLLAEGVRQCEIGRRLNIHKAIVSDIALGKSRQRA